MQPQDVNYIVIHTTATKPNQVCGLKEIDAMHRAKGWNGCGYHLIIRRGGMLEFGRNLDRQGAHVGNAGHNHDSIGVVLEGGLDASGKATATYDKQQMWMLGNVVRGLVARSPDAEVLGHRDLSPDLDGDGVIEPHEWVKQCPCFDVRHWWRNVVQGVDGWEGSDYV